MEKAKVYFTKEITPESIVKIYETLGKELKGNIAIKLHSGEEGNQNYIKPEFLKTIIDKVNGKVVECNTAYNGARNTTEKHIELGVFLLASFLPTDIQVVHLLAFLLLILV